MPFLDEARLLRRPGAGSGRAARAASPPALDMRRIRAELEIATRDGAFILHYQPRVCLKNGEPVGAEALLRWVHRKRGMIAPASFLPAAEASGQITRIGGWVLEAACVEAATWQRGTVCVNVAAGQLRDGALLTQIGAALERSGLPPERLEVEFTESTLSDLDPDMLLTLSAIRDAGAGLVLDDFGTGHASLSLLKHVPLTAIKLDRSLIRGLPADLEDAAIARALTDMGHALGLTVVAEGVETEAQRSFLSATGCDEAQGFLLSPPAPADRVRGCFQSVFLDDAAAET